MYEYLAESFEEHDDNFVFIDSFPSQKSYDY